MLSRQRKGGVGLAVPGVAEAEEVEEEVEAGTHRVTLQKYIVIAV